MSLYGGVGGGRREVSPYPNCSFSKQYNRGNGASGYERDEADRKAARMEYVRKTRVLTSEIAAMSDGRRAFLGEETWHRLQQEFPNSAPLLAVNP